MPSIAIKGDEDFIPKPEVLRILGYSNKQLNNDVKDGRLPAPLALPGRARWLRKDIEATLRAAGAV